MAAAVRLGIPVLEGEGEERLVDRTQERDLHAAVEEIAREASDHAWLVAVARAKRVDAPHRDGMLTRREDRALLELHRKPDRFDPNPGDVERLVADVLELDELEVARAEADLRARGGIVHDLGDDDREGIGDVGRFDERAPTDLAQPRAHAKAR